MAHRDAELNVGDASQPLLAGAQKRGNKLGNLRDKLESSGFGDEAANFARNASQIKGGKADAKAQHPLHKEMKAYIEARQAFDTKAKEKYISLKKHSPCDIALRHLETAKPHPITEFTREQAGLPNQEGKKNSFNTAEERAFLDQAIRDKDFLENELKDHSWHELQAHIEKQRSDLQDSKVIKKPSIADLEKSIQNLARFVAIHKKYQLPLKQMKPTKTQTHPPFISLDVCQGAVKAYQQFLHDLQHPQQPNATPQPPEDPRHRQAHAQLGFGGPSVDEVEVDLEKLLADAPQPFAATANVASKPKPGSTGISSRRRPGGVRTQAEDAKTHEGENFGRKAHHHWRSGDQHQPGTAPVSPTGAHAKHSSQPRDEHSPEPGSQPPHGAQPKPGSDSKKLAPVQTTPARPLTPQPGNPSPKPGPGHQQPKQDSKAAGATGKPGTSSGANPAGDKLTKVQEEVAEVKDIMKANLNKQVDATTGPTGQKVTVEDLDAKVAELDARSKQFDNKAQQPPKKTWKETLSYYCCFCSGSKSNSASAVQKQKEPTATTPFLPKGPGSSRS